MKPTHKQEMALSKLLFEALGIKGVWHKVVRHKIFSNGSGFYECLICEERCNDDGSNNTLQEEADLGAFHAKHLNPNLFTPESFLIVFNAVKDREDWKEEFIDEETGTITFDTSYINAPIFQYLTLEWLLEKEGRVEELEGVLKGEENADT